MAQAAAMRVKDVVGAHGEALAEQLLTAAGMRVLARRWRCAQGELDLVLADGSCLVVCEVKTRRTDAAGSALDAVTPAKLARLRRLTALWLQQQDRSWPDVRIDVVAVSLPRNAPARLEHLVGVQ